LKHGALCLAALALVACGAPGDSDAGRLGLARRADELPERFDRAAPTQVHDNTAW